MPAVRDQRAEQLLGSIAGEEALAMFRALGFLCVPGEDYGYLLYPHRPVVAYDAKSGDLLSEYCVRFEDHSDPENGPALPDADDVLAKWMALRADERELIETANVDRPGRQMDPAQLRKDLRTYELWRATR